MVANEIVRGNNKNLMVTIHYVNKQPPTTQPPRSSPASSRYLPRTDRTEFTSGQLSAEIAQRVEGKATEGGTLFYLGEPTSRAPSSTSIPHHHRIIIHRHFLDSSSSSSHHQPVCVIIIIIPVKLVSRVVWFYGRVALGRTTKQTANWIPVFHIILIKNQHDSVDLLKLKLVELIIPCSTQQRLSPISIYYTTLCL